MKPLRIIYTPDADRFRLSGISASFPKYKGDPETIAMRGAYANLRERVPDLPAVVGVATLDRIIRRYGFDMREEMKDYDMVRVTTTYIPLDIMDAVVQLKNEDASSLLGRNYVYRMLGFLLGHSSVLPGCGTPGWVHAALLFATTIPSMDACAQTIQSLTDKLREGGLDGASESQLQETVARLREMGDWGKVERARAWYYEKFEANRVSRGFPLVFMKPGLVPLELASVSLDDRYEGRVLAAGFEEGVRKYSTTPAEAEALLEQLRMIKDMFGRTTGFVSLGTLLESLPEPKTLITDLYLMDHFPELVKMGFEPVEYMPPGSAATDPTIEAAVR
jgi:hypothetical protein